MWRKKCRECRSVFMAEREWETKCICCWKESKEMDLLAGDKQVRLLQKEVARLEGENRKIRKLVEGHNGRMDQLRAHQQVDGTVGERVMDLLKLCHPDKHNNSQKATDITRWLLQMRGHPRA